MLADVSMSVRPGERAGIVGENGSGKSTLLRLLAGVEPPDDGEIAVADDLGYLGQTLEHTVQQAVDAALAGLRAMERRMRELESALTDDVMDEYGELTAYELRGGYEADARVDKAFRGLGLSHVGRDRRLSRRAGHGVARPRDRPALPGDRDHDGRGTHTLSRTRPTSEGPQMLTMIDGGSPYGVATGPDGALWFTLVHEGRVGRMSPGRQPVIHQLDPADGQPTVITPGADGAMWFTEGKGGRVSRITADGQVTSYEADSPYGIAAGPDGVMWFTQMQTGRIGRIGPGGERAEFEVPVEGGMPAFITAGPDDALWFTINQGNAIGRVSLTGEVSVHPLPTEGAAPVGITLGPDGALWFVEIGAGQVGRIDTSGKITEYPLPDRAARPHAIITGPDGALWFTEWAVGRLGRITTDGAVEEHPLPAELGDGATRQAEPHGLTVGPDGAIWVALEAGALARIG
ncbi:ATP-binding cassette domain-containing protein [Nonomuraea sp. NPDC049400]|uniref:virginiamycin B lyase family protein n=1 Tax=Nonomuraea sp. NPDC049400 TaxID=3364352 RepID=UPI0037AF318C